MAEVDFGRLVKQLRHEKAATKTAFITQVSLLSRGAQMVQVNQGGVKVAHMGAEDCQRRS